MMVDEKSRHPMNIPNNTRKLEPFGADRHQMSPVPNPWHYFQRSWLIRTMEFILAFACTADSTRINDMFK